MLATKWSEAHLRKRKGEDNCHVENIESHHKTLQLSNDVIIIPIIVKLKVEPQMQRPPIEYYNLN